MTTEECGFPQKQGCWANWKCGATQGESHCHTFLLALLENAIVE